MSKYLDRLKKFSKNKNLIYSDKPLFKAIAHVEQLEKENAELKEAICIHVRECMDTSGIDNDQEAVIAFKNTFNEEK